GLAVATGDLIGFLDDDDYLLPDHCARLVGGLIRHENTDAAYAACIEAAAHLDPKAMEFARTRADIVHFRLMGSSGELLDYNPFPIQSVLFRSSIRAHSDRFDTNLDSLEDWLFWMRMLVGHRILAVAEITSVFHVPDDLSEHRVRLKAHQNAQAYFDVQRTAFFETHRLTDMWPVNEDASRQLVKATVRARLAPKPGPWPVKPLQRHHTLDKVLGGDLAP